MEQFEFHKVLFSFDRCGSINLFFLNIEKEQAIVFDGDSFCLRRGLFHGEGLEEFAYLSLVEDAKSSIVGIWHTAEVDDINFIEMGNGDIFQIFNTWDDEKENQKVMIYDQRHKNINIPDGTSLYDAVRKRFIEPILVEF